MTGVQTCALPIYYILDLDSRTLNQLVPQSLRIDPLFRPSTSLPPYGCCPSTSLDLDGDLDLDSVFVLDLNHDLEGEYLVRQPPLSHRPLRTDPLFLH